MESDGEVGILDFLELEQKYSRGHRDARYYQHAFFALMKRRAVLSEDEFWIVLEAYGDADDYDPEIRLPHTIEEPELRKRVAAADRLASLSHAERTPR